MQYTSVRVVSMVVNMQVCEHPADETAFFVCRICHHLSQPVVPGSTSCLVLCSRVLVAFCTFRHVQCLGWGILKLQAELGSACLQIHLRTMSFLIMIHSTQLLWCDVAMSITSMPSCLAVPPALTWPAHDNDMLYCRFQKIGTCTALLEVGNLSVGFPSLPGQAPPGHVLHTTPLADTGCFFQLANPSTSWVGAVQQCGG